MYIFIEQTCTYIFIYINICVYMCVRSVPGPVRPSAHRASADGAECRPPTTNRQEPCESWGSAVDQHPHPPGPSPSGVWVGVMTGARSEPRKLPPSGRRIRGERDVKTLHWTREELNRRAADVMGGNQCFQPSPPSSEDTSTPQDPVGAGVSVERRPGSG